MRTAPDADRARVPTLSVGAGTALARRLAGAYTGRLAPVFVRRVLRAEQRRDRRRSDDVVEGAVRRRLDGWLAGGRYPIPGDEPAPTDPDRPVQRRRRRTWKVPPS